MFRSYCRIEEKHFRRLDQMKVAWQHLGHANCQSRIIFSAALKTSWAKFLPPGIDQAEQLISNVSIEKSHEAKCSRRNFMGRNFMGALL